MPIGPFRNYLPAIEVNNVEAFNAVGDSANDGLALGFTIGLIISMIGGGAELMWGFINTL